MALRSTRRHAHATAHCSCKAVSTTEPAGVHTYTHRSAQLVQTASLVIERALLDRPPDVLTLARALMSRTLTT